MPRPILRQAAAALLALLAACASDSGGPAGKDCRDPAAMCTLGETADQAGQRIGAAVSASNAYVAIQHFNSLTGESALKWGELTLAGGALGSHDFQRADALVDLAQQRGLRFRGHALVWGKFPGHGHPYDLEQVVFDAPDPAARLRELLAEHVAITVGRYAGRIECWDVVNEPLNMFGSGFEDNVFYRALGEAYIGEAFALARAADPAARLFLNENLLVYDDSRAAAFLALVTDLVAAGVPIDGVGLQAHAMLELPEQPVLQDYLQRIADLGLDVELTEMDVTKVALTDVLRRGADLYEAQAEVYRTMAAACVAVERCTGMTVWGVDDSRSWLDEQVPFDMDAPNEPLLLDAELQPKPAYHAIREVLAERIGME